ncbi:MAG: GPR endopeptidase [Eubacterium sp.]|nr:GPR endopeptidase [Eubacterium sp.]
MEHQELYTDLALEEREKYEKEVEISGVKIDEEQSEELKMTITTVEIVNQHGERAMGKPKGKYITVESRLLKENMEKLQREFSEQLKEVLLKVVGKKSRGRVLVVGLGNANATPDALGPKVTEKINVGEGVLCIAPGVWAQTGMETFDIVKGVVEEVKPDLILVIDSLASRNIRRVTTTVQITDTGITPGSGVGNHRKGISEASLKRKVIAIGVPMVVSGATIVNDTMEKLLGILKMVKKSSGWMEVLDGYTQEEKYQLFEELLSEETEQTFVTPKDVDEIVENLSVVIAEAVNRFCHEWVIC